MSDRKALRGSPRRTARIAALGALAILLVYLSLYVFASNTLRKVDPALALKVAPTSSAALSSRLEERMLEGGTGAELRPLAERAIRRDSLNTSAWRILGLIEATSGNVELAVRILTFANYLSRRDNATNMWLIEQHLQQNDIPGALEYYDYAMRTSLSLREQLLPPLVAATAERDVIPPLVDVLLRSPTWADDFFAALNNLAPDGANAAMLVGRLKDGGYAGSYEILRALPERFANLGQVEAASEIHTHVSGRKPASTGLLDFVGKNPIAPFDWAFAADGSFEAAAITESGEDGSGVLLVRADSDQRKTAARRLLLLAPGNYALSAGGAAISGPAPERLIWEIACHGGGAPIGTTPVPVGDSSRTLRFQVPRTGCSAQWLSLSVTTGTNPATSEIEVPSPVLRAAGA